LLIGLHLAERLLLPRIRGRIVQPALVLLHAQLQRILLLLTLQLVLCSARAPGSSAPSTAGAIPLRATASHNAAGARCSTTQYADCDFLPLEWNLRKLLLENDFRMQLRQAKSS